MMNCEDMSMKMSAYLDRELSALEAKEIEEHLKFCSSCRKWLSQFSRLDEFRSLLSPEEVTEEEWRQCWEGIKNKTADTRAYTRKRYARVAFYSGLVATAACIAVAVSVYLATLPGTAPTEAQEVSIVINDYDDSQYTLLVEDKPDFAIIRLTPIRESPNGG